MKYEIEELKAQIRNLLLMYPELADDEDLRTDTVEGATDLKEIIEHLLNREKDAEVLVEGIGKRVSDLVGRRNKLKDRQQSIRAVILSLLHVVDLRKLELPEATISVIRTGPSVQIVDEGLVPDTLCRFKREVSKTAIKEALLAGEEVPGAVLTNGNVTLRIA